MDGLDRTTRLAAPARPVTYTTGSLVTVFDGNTTPRTLRLDAFGKGVIQFGRAPGNDIVLTSHLVSGEHGRFVNKGGAWVIEDKAAYKGTPSTNGIIYNNASIISRMVGDGDFIRIDDNVQTVADGVLFVFSSADSNNKWYNLPLNTKPYYTIGRDQGCDVVLPHVSVSKNHARITREAGGYFITDCGSANGIIVNNRRVVGKVRLQEKDVINITNSKLIFSAGVLYYCCYRSGISVDATGIVVKRGKGRKAFITSNHVSLGVKPGELVAIIGGNGAGKSTILNCMCGYLPPTEGQVYINGVNLYQNFDFLKKLIGYVPQQDIVYDNLTLHDMLMYTAKLRLPKDTSKAEMEAAINRAIEMVELTEKKNSFIKALSGGQRKRASIAVELLSDPNLLFLDEPSSGLDPGTERNLMQSLRKMADNGKTVILVTHSTLQLKMCDKIVFMGKGGNLCFYGSHDEALGFFGVTDIVDVYNMITDNSKLWSKTFEATRERPGKIRETAAPGAKKKESVGKQLAVISMRYLKLVTNDRQRLLLLLIQAPLLAFLISVVADGNQYKTFSTTQSLLFALSCSAFWVGMLNAIQEICKERTILRREYMTGLSLTAYITSKIIVLGALCCLQSLMIVGVFSSTVGLPEEGIIGSPFMELFISTALTAIAATAMGLFVSSLFSNPDRAMTVAPILLMPQILFSGVIFQLEGSSQILSDLAVCRWSMIGYGVSAKINDLPASFHTDPTTGMEFPVPVSAERLDEALEPITSNLTESWLMLAAFVVGFLLLARIVLGKIAKEKS